MTKVKQEKVLWLSWIFDEMQKLFTINLTFEQWLSSGSFSTDEARSAKLFLHLNEIK